MTRNEPKAFTRRQFLAQGVTLASASVTLPAFLQRSALGLPTPAPMTRSMPGVPEDHVLVVVQLSGGNDGLNTVVPFGDPGYYNARPGIAIPEPQTLKLARDAGLGLHPSMEGIKELYDEGLCAIVQGIGYPNPNRSHFMSMDIWHTADTDATGNGWIGRYFDHQCCGYGKGESGNPEQANSLGGQPGVALGREAPLAMQGAAIAPISFETPELFQWTGEQVHPSLVEPYNRILARGSAPDPGHGPNSSFLMRTALDAQVSSDLIRDAVARKPRTAYPRSGLARDLSMVASMINAGLDTRVYYVTLGGFDTHAGQGGVYGGHARLLDQFSGALRAFYADLAQQGNDARVLTMSFSEFGRRVKQNASGGTDHGTAAPMFLFGPMVKPGVHARHPSLTDLDAGDLKFAVDFRSVYASILQSWLGADPGAILGGRFRPAPVLKT